ncbi:MAG: ATP-binding protein [Chloroflexota bacterium]
MKAIAGSMDVLLILLLQAFVYSVFPFYFVTLPYYRRNVAFDIYLSIALVLGGFFGSLYSFPITDSISISGGNLTYGAFMMTIILLVMLEHDLDVVRTIIRIVIMVNIFVFLLFTSLSLALSSDAVINPFGASADIFSVSIPFMILGGVLIIVELGAFIVIFEQVKKWLDNTIILAILYVVFYVLTLVLDGILFPAIAFSSNPQLVNIIAGNVGGKVLMGAIFAVPMLLFVALNHDKFSDYTDARLDFSQIITFSREELAEALQDSENRYELLVDNSPYGIGIYQHDKIAFINQAGCDLVGVNDYTDLLGQSFLTLVPDELRESSQKVIDMLLAGKLETFSTETELVKRDGTRVAVEVLAVPLKYQGEPALQLIASDITARRQAEEARQQANILQVELEKERELRELKTRFTSMIVHDFRNPVAAISMSTEVMQRYLDPPNTAKITERTERILRTTKRLNDLIDDVLDLERMETVETNFNPQEQDFVAFIQELVEQFGNRYDEQAIDLCFDAIVPEQTLAFDAELMTRAIMNLLSNAVKYSPDDPRVIVTVAKDDSYLKVEICDNGIGISEDDLPRIFDFFHRASNATRFKGTGIGLAIVKQVIETHGGEITCESTLGEGTTFTICLPIESE